MIDDLPNELLILIFEHLKTKDLVRCRLVCKRFKSLCRYVKVSELIISNTIENVKDFWFYTNKQFNYQDAISVTTLNSYRSIFRLTKLRRLNFEGSQSEYAQLKVNDLTELEQVKINVQDMVDGEHEVHINLPNLKILNIDTSSREFFITTPKLEVLRCRDFDVIHLTYPNTIRHLETDFYRDSFHALKNVEFIQLAESWGDFNWSETLSAFPELTTFSYYGVSGQFPKALKNWMKYKRKHQLTVPKLYFQSVELDDVSKIHDYFKYRFDSMFQTKNYNSLAETVFISRCADHFHYQFLMSTMGKIPEDFFKKFVSTRGVNVYGEVDNQEQLFGFLKNFDYLTELDLISDLLNESFYNRLGELHQLRWLSITIGRYLPTPIKSFETTLNFDFLLKIKQLRCFSTNFDSPKLCYLAPELFRRLKYFRQMSYYYANQSTSISTQGVPKEYHFMSSRYKKGGLDFNRLVRLIHTFTTRHIIVDENLFYFPDPDGTIAMF